MIRGILLDIEGTTTPIAFVYDVLFPYARRHLPEHMSCTDLADLLHEYEDEVRAGNNPPGSSTDLLPYLYWLMDQDRKSTALKRIQGEIWLDGFQKGVLRGEVFDDVAPALQRWHGQGIDIRIFSSGSTLAQRLVFSTTKSGDLTKYIKGYFDTTTGPKIDLASYGSIAEAFAVPASEVLFISDVTGELDPARDAGMATLLCVRPGNPVQPAQTHKEIVSFDNVTL